MMYLRLYGDALLMPWLQLTTGNLACQYIYIII